MSAPGRRGPYAKTQQRRAEIARATFALVQENGHKDVSIAAVAERTGLSQATVTYHFPTRDHLLVAAMEASEEFGGASQLAALPPETLLLDVGRVIALSAEVGVREPNRLHLFTALAAEAGNPEHPAHTWLIEHHARLRQWLAEALRSLQASGQAHPDLDPDRFARQMVALWDGLQSQWLADQEFNYVEELESAFRLLSRADIMEARRAMAALAAEL